MSSLVSIVIVNYNVKDLLFKCIGSIFKNSNSSFEIIVVDNNSTDGSVEMIRERFPTVRIIENNYNAGFPKANNQGFAKCTGKYIFMLNPDTEIVENAIDKMVAYIEKDNTISLIAPRLLNTDGSIQYSIQRFVTVTEIVLEIFFLHYFYKIFHSYLNSPVNQPIQVEALSGAAILFPYSIYKEIGGLDVELFWTEDMEFCYRAYKHNKKIIYFPGAEVIHHIGASGVKNMNVMISRQVLSKITFFKKNHSRFSYLLVLNSRYLHVLSRILIFNFLALFGNKTFSKKAKAYIFTLSELIKHKF